MIRLSDGCYVAADQIVEVEVSDYGNVTVRMKSGVGHHVDNDYGKSGYETARRLVDNIDATIQHGRWVEGNPAID